MYKVKVLYVGSMNPSSNSFKRFKALEKLGVQLESIDIEQLLYHSMLTPLYHRYSFGPAVWNLNKIVLRKAKEFYPDIIWVDNKSYLLSKTLVELKEFNKKLHLINVVTDDPNGKYRGHWQLTRRTARYFDWHFVQRPENVADFKSWGSPNVEFCFRSFDPAFHRKISLTGEDLEYFKCNVGFIGTYEVEREEFIAFLIEQGIQVQVTGDGWPRGKFWEIIKEHYKGPSVYGDNYIKAINGMDIALHFLRKGNRDQQDSRTFEIPACGTFMIAERSPLHELFFKENIEAVLFDTKQELLEKVRYYLNNPKTREAIAEAGFQRAMGSGYDHESRMKSILNLVLGN